MRKPMVDCVKQVAFCVGILLFAGFLLTGCTVVINSENVTTATEATNAVLGGL
ncbi:MAG: hypothetical protein ACRCW3_00180 [Metamycoplasmataceae bacterium]